MIVTSAFSSSTFSMTRNQEFRTHTNTHLDINTNDNFKRSQMYVSDHVCPSVEKKTK